MDETVELGPQPGPQTAFLSSPADIAIYGGAAGSGKSFAILIEPIRHYYNELFRAMIFRRTSTAIRTPGGLWDESMGLYTKLRGSPREQQLDWTFPGGMLLKFAGIEHENDVHHYHGAQLPFIGFDELTQFTEKQFVYMMSRNRSVSGVKPYMRATCNPDPDSFVRRWIDWWIGEDGYPIQERSGKLRWFKRDGDTMVWGDDRFSEDAKSLTFIPAKTQDNQILMKKDPSYISNLKALAYVDRMRLLEGNWNIRASAGMFFRRHYFEIVDALPPIVKKIRYWDRAASKSPEADWTVGVLMGKTSSGVYVVPDVVRFKGSPLEVEMAILNTAKQDGYEVEIGIEQDPGQAGVSEAQAYTRRLAGYNVKLYKVTKDKQTRAKPLSAQAEAGNLKLLRGRWNEDYLTEMESFPEGKKDDQVDSSSGAFNALAGNTVGSFTKDLTETRIESISGPGGDEW